LVKPIASRTPLEKWNYWWGRIFNVKLPDKVKPFIQPTTGCSANINIILHLLNETSNLNGDIAECGVFQGATLSSLTYFLGKKGDKRKIYGFDSFEGFGNIVEKERLEGDTAHIDLETEMFKNTSMQRIEEKFKLVNADTNKVKLVKGFFENSLPAFDNNTFSFVHLDCDLAESYLTCLHFFYSRMEKGGIILFDEYKDPVYTQATDAIDNFFKDKPEKPIQINRDNYLKSYIQIAG
jgi:hypothetical protein